MKKPIIFLAIVVLLCQLTVASYAAQDALNIKDVCGSAGDIVYLELYLNETYRGDTVAVSFSYDKQYLQLVEDQCTWAKEGVLQDFDKRKNAGVWADDKENEFSGVICTLAFRVIAEQEYFSTVVSCKMVLKNGTEETGSLLADAWVCSPCDHSFGAWNDTEQDTHMHTCQQCGYEETKSHNWDAGVTREDPEQPDLAITTFTCADCGAVTVEKHTSNEPPVNPDTTKPAHKPTNPAEPQPTDPDNDPNGGNIGDAKWLGVAAGVGVAAVLAAAAWLFLKKKHK